LPRPWERAPGTRRARRSGGTRPSRDATRPGPAHTAPGRSARARSAWTHHRGSRSVAGARSGPGSTRSPSGGPDGAHAADRSTGRARHSRAVRGHDRAREPILHVLPQRIVRCELGHLRAPGTPIGTPLGGRGPILETTATGRSIAAQLLRDRRRRPAQPPRPQVEVVLTGLGLGESPRWHAGQLWFSDCSRDCGRRSGREQ